MENSMEIMNFCLNPFLNIQIEILFGQYIFGLPARWVPKKISLEKKSQMTPIFCLYKIIMQYIVSCLQENSGNKCHF